MTPIQRLKRRLKIDTILDGDGNAVPDDSNINIAKVVLSRPAYVDFLDSVSDAIPISVRTPGGVVEHGAGTIGSCIITCEDTEIPCRVYARQERPPHRVHAERFNLDAPHPSHPGFTETGIFFTVRGWTRPQGDKPDADGRTCDACHQWDGSLAIRSKCQPNAAWAPKLTPKP